jgi:2-polyprenyl-3-methyl-5-hydroxy-6-metoxy-1,4-benzoquinol methylase
MGQVLSEFEDMSDCGPPPVTASDWDQYWRRKLAFQAKFDRELGGAINFFDVLSDATLFEICTPLFRSRGYRSVLIIGNGTSLLPYALSGLGFSVTAQDISEVAADWQRAVDPYYITKYLNELTESWSNNRSKCSVPVFGDPGQVDFQTGTFLDPDHCSGPFDVIVAMSVLQYYARNTDYAQVCELLVNRLSPNGMLYCDFINDPSGRVITVQHCTALGCRAIREQKEVAEVVADESSAERVICAVLHTG